MQHELSARFPRVQMLKNLANFSERIYKANKYAWRPLFSCEGGKTSDRTLCHWWDVVSRNISHLPTNPYSRVHWLFSQTNIIVSDFAVRKTRVMWSDCTYKLVVTTLSYMIRSFIAFWMNRWWVDLWNNEVTNGIVLDWSGLEFTVTVTMKTPFVEQGTLSKRNKPWLGRLHIGLSTTGLWFDPPTHCPTLKRSGGLVGSAFCVGLADPVRLQVCVSFCTISLIGFKLWC